MNNRITKLVFKVIALITIIFVCCVICGIYMNSERKLLENNGYSYERNFLHTEPTKAPSPTVIIFPKTTPTNTPIPTPTFTPTPTSTPTPTFTPIPTPQKTTYTEEDLFNLAVVVCREAGGDSEEIQLLVANVVINRVNHRRYPDTIEGVLTQYRQYGMMWKNGISFPKWATSRHKEQCYAVAKRILDGERVCPENVIYQSEKKQGSGVYKEFNGFYFCYE